MECPTQDTLDAIFPPERADQFFDAIYGGAEDGAYDIRIICKNAQDDALNLAFELRRREGKCLKCSLTYGLPDVFRRHPLLDLPGTSLAIAKACGLGENIQWELGPVREVNDDLHIIPYAIKKIAS